MQHPLVSICIPTYNGAAYLQQALDSVTAQTYSSLEVVISDDHSSDATLAIAEAFKKRAPLPVRIYDHLPSGIGANWNNCMEKARGTYIKFLFQDDILYPDCVEVMIEVLEKYPNVGLVASNREILVEKSVNPAFAARWIKNCGNLQEKFGPQEEDILFLDNSFFKSPLFYKGPINAIGEPTVVMFRKSVLDTIGPFNIHFKQVLDVEFWFRLLRSYPIAILKQSYAAFRLHGSQASITNLNNNIFEKEGYDKILYRDYYKLLNIKLRRKLLKKYHPFHSNFYKVKTFLGRIYHGRI